MIILSIVASVLIWSDLSNVYNLVLIISIISFGLIGFIDDFTKLKKARRHVCKTKFFAIYYRSFIYLLSSGQGSDVLSSEY